MSYIPQQAGPAQPWGAPVQQNQTTQQTQGSAAEKPPPYPKVVRLLEHQKDAAQKAYEILCKSYMYYDTSQTGAGKTFLLLHLAQVFNLPLFVVCPGPVKVVWRKYCEEYGIELIFCETYDILRGTKSYPPSHGYLHRTDESKKTYFTATESLRYLVQRGVLFVFDEAQNMKNSTSAKTKACLGLADAIWRYGGPSRIAFLSATPIDKPEQLKIFIRITGFCRADKYVGENGGYKEMLELCRRIDKATSDEFDEQYPLNTHTVIEKIKILVLHVIKPNLFVSMEANQEIHHLNDVANGFFNIDKSALKLLNQAIKNLGDAVDDIQEGTGSAPSSITFALEAIEYAKAYDMARVAMKILSSNPNSKVIISINYNRTKDFIVSTLTGFNPMVMCGKVVQKKRDEIVKKFQEHNANHRLIIMNTLVGSVGISLHDTHGGFPRTMLISPSYRMMEITQASGRIARSGLKSKATVRMFYGKATESDESGILSSLTKKAKTMRIMLDDKTTKDLKAPDDYPRVDEE